MTEPERPENETEHEAGSGVGRWVSVALVLLLSFNAVLLGVDYAVDQGWLELPQLGDG